MTVGRVRACSPIAPSCSCSFLPPSDAVSGRLDGLAASFAPQSQAQHGKTARTAIKIVRLFCVPNATYTRHALAFTLQTTSRVSPGVLARQLGPSPAPAVTRGCFTGCIFCWLSKELGLLRVWPASRRLCSVESRDSPCFHPLFRLLAGYSTRLQLVCCGLQAVHPSATRV